MFRNLSASALGITGRQSEIIELSLSYGFKGIDIDLLDARFGIVHERQKSRIVFHSILRIRAPTPASFDSIFS